MAGHRFSPRGEGGRRRPARLAFVHVLRVDKAGPQGAACPARRTGRPRAGPTTCSGKLLQAAPADAQTRWFVLSDHGHRPRRRSRRRASRRCARTRACIAGGARPIARPGDLAGSDRSTWSISRARSAIRWAAPRRRAASGRPLAVRPRPPRSRARPCPGRRRPRPGWPSWCSSAALAARPGAPPPAGRPLVRLPLWLPLPPTWACWLFRGLPTLSNPIVYPPLGRRRHAWRARPGLLVLALLALVGARASPGRLRAFCRAQLALPAGVAGACLVACGGPSRPGWTRAPGRRSIRCGPPTPALFTCWPLFLRPALCSCSPRRCRRCEAPREPRRGAATAWVAELARRGPSREVRNPAERLGSRRSRRKPPGGLGRTTRESEPAAGFESNSIPRNVHLGLGGDPPAPLLCFTRTKLRSAVARWRVRLGRAGPPVRVARRIGRQGSLSSWACRLLGQTLVSCSATGMVARARASQRRRPAPVRSSLTGGKAR